MPTRNPVRYNSGTTLNYSISKNQLSFGINNVDYGPTSQTKWYANSNLYGYLIVSDSYSQGVTSEQNSYPIFWGNTASTISGITSVINGLPARYGQPEFTDIETAIAWLEGEFIYGIQNRTYENIATSGLTLLYDAGATLSYPTLGNTIYDLGSSNVNGTLQNSPTFVNSEGGYIDLNATSSQYISFIDLGTLSNFTVGCWFKLNQEISGGTYPTLVTNTFAGGSNINFALGQLPSWDGKISGGFFDTTWRKTDGFVPVVGQWYYVVLTYDGAHLRLYKDGILFSEVATSGSAISSGLGGYIGRRWDNPEYIDGGVAITQIYNRAISYLEVYQNMSAQAARYSVPIPPIPVFGTSDVMLLDNTTNYIYKYDFSTNEITYLFSAATTSLASQITTTDSKIFISESNGTINQYSYTPIPFAATYETSYTFTSGSTKGMTAINNNTLLITNDKTYTYNLSADTIDLLFSFSGGSSFAGVAYDNTTQQLALNYTGSGVNYVSIFGYSGNPISSISYQPYSGGTYPELINSAKGVFTYNNKVYVITTNFYIYEVDFNNLIIYTPTQPTNLTTETVSSSSSISVYNSWTNPSPYFYY